MFQKADVRSHHSAELLAKSKLHLYLRFALYMNVFRLSLLSGRPAQITTRCFMSILMTKFRSCLFPGFDDQDMERPSFTQPAQYPSVPLVLSKPGAQPVIQVRILIKSFVKLERFSIESQKEIAFALLCSVIG